MKEYEIWLGYYNCGDGSIDEPMFLGKVEAIDFTVACLKYELESKLESIKLQEDALGYVDKQSLHWFYNPNTNSNSWTGKYYQSKEEAQKSFSNN